MNKPYSITFLSNTFDTVTFQYTCPDNPFEQWEWWALYKGSVPEYKDLEQYLTWGWICPEQKGCESSGTKTVNLRELSNGDTYSLVLFKWKWDVVDSQEFTVELQYELKRQVLCLNRLCDSLFSANNVEANKDTERNLNNRAIKKLTDFFADPKVQQLIGQWTLVWGPVIYHKYPDSKAKRDNLMYVVQKHNTSQYAIAIAGTSSAYGWLEEDFTVNQLEDWATFLESASLENKPLDNYEDLRGTKISHGTSIGLGILMNQMKYDGRTLIGWIHNEMKKYPQEEVEIIVTGHSLGGALSPSLALALIDLQQQWNPTYNAKVFALPTAGATAGNREFALHYNSKLEKSSLDKLGANRIWNQIDMVPHAWETDMLEKVPNLYQKYDLDSNFLLHLAVGIAYDDSIDFLRESKIDWHHILSSLSKVLNFQELFTRIFHENSPYEQICKNTALSFLGEFQKDEAKKQATKILNNRKDIPTTTEILSETKILTNILLKVHGKPEQMDKDKLKSDLENLFLYPALEVIKSGDDSNWEKTVDNSVKELLHKHPSLKSGIFTGIEELALEKVLLGLPVLLTFLFQAGYQHVPAYVQYYNISDYMDQLKEHGIVEED
ncbi:MAG: lipase family protein [Symploca sp. SIO3C6]|nr:lipase family protein [Symploca sp. SIO3C6]NET07062.1 lipase family protein [Symploca sp. SIO2B6]